MSLRSILSTRTVLNRSLTNTAKSKYLNTMVQRNYTAAAKPVPKTAEDPSAPGPMLRYQKNLPSLIVPKLDETLNKYLTTVRPLLSDAEFKKTMAAVEEFRKPGGVGETLQKRLEGKAAGPNVVNWLEDWWNDLSYMGYRDPVMVYVSYFYAYKDDKLRKTPAARAASIVTGALEFRKLVVEAKLEPEYAKGEPLCMDSYKYMFNACRIPRKPSDYEAIYDSAANNHITVMRNSKFYILETIHEGKQLSTAEFEAQFQRIIDDAGYSKDLPIGILTSENRDTWTDYREVLLNAHPSHKDLLEKIQSSIFLVALDDTKPVTRDELSRACWHGNGLNRFYDIPCQFIVFENGKAGFNGEHSCMDGTPTCRLNDYILTGLHRNKFDHGSETVRSSLPAPNNLKFKFNAEIEKAVASATDNFEMQTGKHELKVLAYNNYGKGLIKKFKVSPDAYVQMVIQLAYYKMFGINRPTYESAQTRKYQHGRTETVRTVSADSIAWAKAMEDPKVSTEVKAKLGQKAIASHIHYANECSEGKGVDRHLLGLRLSIRPDEPKPAIFQDPTYSYSSHWYLSTSQLSSEHFDGYGWGEVVPDGFGIAYMIKEHSLHFNVVSLKNLEVHGKREGGPEQMRHFLSEAADDMKDVFSAELAKTEGVKAKL